MVSVECIINALEHCKVQLPFFDTHCTVISTRVEIGKFTQFRVFPIFTSVDITVYQYGKNVLYFFYNIAQRTLTEEWWEIFRVGIELYQHGS